MGLDDLRGRSGESEALRGKAPQRRKPPSAAGPDRRRRTRTESKGVVREPSGGEKLSSPQRAATKSTGPEGMKREFSLLSLDRRQKE